MSDEKPEAVALLIDNSEWGRNADYVPTRFSFLQQMACGLAKTILSR